MRPYLLFLVLPLLLLMACGGGDAPASQAGRTPAVAAATFPPTWTPAPSPTEPTPGPTETPSTTPLPGAELSPIEEGLRSIDEASTIRSYKMHIAQTITTLDGAGAVVEESITTRDLQVSREPAGRHMTIQTEITSSNSELAALLEAGVLGDYLLVEERAFSVEEGEWQETSLSNIEDHIQTPSFSDQTGSDPLPLDLSVMEFVGQEEINGRSTRHLRGDHGAALLSGMEGLTGQADVWVDEAEGFVVRYDATVTLQFSADSSSVSHTLIEFFDFNVPIDLTVPSVAPLLSNAEVAANLQSFLGFALPLAPDALFLQSSPTKFEVETNQPLSEVRTQVLAALASNGYILDEGEDLSGTGRTWRYVVHRGESYVYLLIFATEDGKSEILISATTASP
ncbi:MAG: hypothetical protein H0T73_10395 [Ardenticatenales bacterium]|nr:hypothetical protein [Ardenticatenales bacterium]